MDIKAPILRSIARARPVNRVLNGFGGLVRGLHSGYVIGGSRSIAEMSPSLQQSGTLEIRSDGIFIDHSRCLSTNTFLIEAFLRHSITKINIEDSISVRDLQRLYRGKEVDELGFKVLRDTESAKEQLPQVVDTNNKKTMKTNALAALYGGLTYASYKILATAVGLGVMDSVDIACSSILLMSTVLACGINVLKQSMCIESIKHKDPVVSTEEKTAVSGPNGPKVTLLIPAYNEPVKVLRETLRAASRIRYENLEIVLLLDSKPDSENFKAVMEMYSKEFAGSGNIKVFARKLYTNIANKRLNKADNINAFMNYAHGKSLHTTRADGAFVLEETQTNPSMSFTDSEYIMITDADYLISPEFLEETVPLLARDSQKAYVMTPQNFELNKGNPTERANATLMNSSWQVVNKGFANSGRVLFGGCNAIIRKSAIEETVTTRATGEKDWLPSDTVTEDLSLTLKFMDHGFGGDFVSKPLATGMPIGSLGDHLFTFWRYAEGSIENTFKQTIPGIRRGSISAFSIEAAEYLSKAVNPILGGITGLISLAPLAALYGVKFPISTPIALILYYFLLSNSAKSTLKAAGEEDSFAHAKLTSLMYMHFPVFVDATYTAIKNCLLGESAGFRTTQKDGERTRLPLKYLLPLLGLMTADVYAAAGHMVKFFEAYELWRIESSAWASLPILGIGYGLAHFNGVANTLSDLKEGVSRFARLKYEAVYALLGRINSAPSYSSLAPFLS